MLIPEAGVHQISERYFFTPSSLAQELFYYPTRCGHYFCSGDYRFGYQSEIALQGDHNQNIMLFLVQGGAVELELNGTQTLAAAGQVVLFDCREPYRYWASEGLEFTWLLFNGLNTYEFYRRIIQAHGEKHVFAPNTFHEIVQNLNILLQGCAEGERLSEPASSQLLHKILCLLLVEDTGVKRGKDDFVKQAIRYMNAHLYEAISVEQVAGVVNLSPSHFSRQFKRSTGYSPYEYIILRRLDRAKYLLTSTQLTVKEIAFEIGYNSEENFIHSFQKNVGISPGLFRKYPI